MINFEKQVRKIFRSHVQHVIDNPKLYGINPRFLPGYGNGLLHVFF